MKWGFYVITNIWIRGIDLPFDFDFFIGKCHSRVAGLEHKIEGIFLYMPKDILQIFLFYKFLFVIPKLFEFYIGFTQFFKCCTLARVCLDQFTSTLALLLWIYTGYDMKEKKSVKLTCLINLQCFNMKPILLILWWNYVKKRHLDTSLDQRK